MARDYSVGSVPSGIVRPGYEYVVSSSVRCKGSFGGKGYATPVLTTPECSEVTTLHVEVVALLTSICEFEHYVAEHSQKAATKPKYGPWYRIPICLSRLHYHTNPALFDALVTTTPDAPIAPVEYQGKRWESYHRMACELSQRRFDELERRLVKLAPKCDVPFWLKRLSEREALVEQFVDAVVQHFSDIAATWNVPPLDYDELNGLLELEYRNWMRRQQPVAEKTTAGFKLHIPSKLPVPMPQPLTAEAANREIPAHVVDDDWIHAVNDDPPQRFQYGPLTDFQTALGYAIRYANLDPVTTDRALRDYLKEVATANDSRVWLKRTGSKKLEAYFHKAKTFHVAQERLKSFPQWKSAETNGS